MVKISRRILLGLLASSITIPLLDLYIIEPEFIVAVTRIELNIKKRPLKLEKYRIVHISDTHFGSSKFRAIYDIALNTVKQLNPDLIAYTGDLISRRAFLYEAINFVEKLSSISQVCAVLGNWDHWSLGEDILAFKKLLESIDNVRVLVNENIEVEDNFYIVGVDDPYTMHDRLDKALQGIKEHSVIILLAHSPEIVGKAANKVDIILAGHTHGGQVVLPLLGPLYVPLPRKYRRYVSGLFKVGETYMYVNRGIGTSILPIRFMCSPEVTCLDFKWDTSQ